MTLVDSARVLRSKNAGPLQVTIDIIFDTADAYALATRSPALAPAAIAMRYGVEPASVEVIFVPPARAIKINLPRTIVAGTPGDRDVYGAQQHRALLDIEL